MKTTIKHKTTGEVLREYDGPLREVNLCGADLSGADLSWANLRWADLRWADLSGESVIDAGQDRRGYRFVAIRGEKDVMVLAGCHWFTLAEAQKHWLGRHKDNKALRVECLAKVGLIDETAKARGWEIGE